MSEITDAPAVVATRKPIPDGVYLDLPFDAYLADDATGGSTCLKLLTDPGAIQWENERNPLWDAPEKKPATRGQATHAAVLEGIEAYEQRFCVAPPGCIRTGKDMEDVLRKAGLKISGTVAEQRARIEEWRKTYVPQNEGDQPIPTFFDEAVAGRTVISARDDKYVRVVANFLRSDPTFGPILVNGVPEVSIFATINGERFKGRIDLMTGTSLVNLKTYMRPPSRGVALRTHLVRNAYYAGNDLQAVVQRRCAVFAANNDLPVVGGTDEAANRVHKILADYRKSPPVYRWLFARTDGAPTAIMVPFRVSDVRWQFAEQEVNDAVANLQKYRAACGDGDWITSAGEQEIESDIDWPYGSIFISDIETGDA